ncbi:hypothetical protein [Roseixanthobacter glucoisosaccharinicivorans]|uniref:hypothetical protein n=1 Tax=Roseixanthobacter glucoisosaccharinicivorans TaxID=3119923 RepID=UPI003727484A
MADEAEALKVRLRKDLRDAMVAREPVRVRVLRLLVSELDNAQAVPLASEHKTYVVRDFGDPSVEVPRLSLTADAVRRLLELEIAARHAAAAEMAGVGQLAQADVLREEARIIDAYLR